MRPTRSDQGCKNELVNISGNPGLKVGSDGDVDKTLFRESVVDRIGLAVALVATAGAPARAQEMKICKRQTYALCAAARCNVFDGV